MLTVSLSMVLLATAMWVRKTVPLIMVWSTLFFFFAFSAVHWSVPWVSFRQWRLIDLWNDTYLVGSRCLGVGPRASSVTRRTGLAKRPWSSEG